MSRPIAMAPSISFPLTSIGMGALLLLILYRLRVWYRSGHSRLPYPPGPPGLPYIGGLGVPKEPAWETYRKWGETFSSDVIRFNLLGTNLIVLNSVEAMVDLLDKRSSIYSDRPISSMTMLRELCGMEWTLGILPYAASEWRDGRKIFQRELHARVVPRYHPLEERETQRLLNRLLHTPDRFLAHLHLMTSAIMLTVAYGMEIGDEDDPWIALGENAMESVRQTCVPGAYLVDAVPILKYLPEWFPGAAFKVQAREWKQDAEDLLNKPFDIVKRQWENDPGSVQDCVAKSLLQSNANEKQVNSYGGHVARSTTATLYLAGTDTTLAILQSFFLAMVFHPAEQRAAQAAIDCVCSGRLPSCADMDALPHIHALVREVIRWKPVGPLNLPHMCTQDDVYRGWYIPRGAVVFANLAAMLHDPATYHDPGSFLPSRFLTTGTSSSASEPTLDKSVRDPTHVIFGAGRRVCPGRHMAYDVLWLTMARVLAVFDIAPALDEHGKEVLPTGEYDTGLTWHPKPFECRVMARSDAHRALIQEMGI